MTPQPPTEVNEVADSIAAKINDIACDTIKELVSLVNPTPLEVNLILSDVEAKLHELEVN